MPPARPIAIHCEISPGGFSGERIVRVRKSDGSIHVSLAPSQYCWVQEGGALRRVKPEEPGKNEKIEGLVAARWMQDSNGHAVISLPDGDVILVNKNLFAQRPEESHVPL